MAATRLALPHTLRGPVPDRIIFYPHDPRTRRLDDADAMFRGRFRLAGDKLEVKKGSVFDRAPPSDGIRGALHGFDWLRHLEAAGGDAARELARNLTAEWLVRNTRYAARLAARNHRHSGFSICSPMGVSSCNAPMSCGARGCSVSLRNQARVLARTHARCAGRLAAL